MGQPTTAPTEAPRVFQEMGDEYAIRREFILDEHKPAEAARYVAAVTNLHGQLQPGELVYVLNNQVGRHQRYEQPPLVPHQGIYTVKEPGVTPGEDDKRLAIKAELEGIVIDGGHNAGQYGWSVENYPRYDFQKGVLLHAGHGQDIEDLENTEEFGKDLFRPQFVIGKVAVERAIKEHPTDSPAFNLQLAIVAAQYGIEIPLEDVKVTPDIQDHLKRQLIFQMGKQVTGAETIRTDTDWSFTPTLSDHKKEDEPESVTCDVTRRPPELIRPLAIILGLTPEEVKTKLNTRIDNLEAAVLNGEQKAAEYPRVQVGRLRLDRYVTAVFEG